MRCNRGQLQHPPPQRAWRGLDRAREALESGIAACSRRSDGDLAGFQRSSIQADALAERLGMHVAMGSDPRPDGRPYGNAVLTRFAIIAATPSISPGGADPRGAEPARPHHGSDECCTSSTCTSPPQSGAKRADQVKRLVREHIHARPI